MEELKVLFSEDEVDKRLKEMAEEIDKDYLNKEIVVISVLKGAIFFSVDLVKKMKTRMEMDFIKVSSYEGTESTGKINLKSDLKTDIENKDVLILEDIIDTGNTLNHLKEYLLSKNPRSLKIAVLLDKKERRKVDVKVDYTGFVIPDKFIIGYGFDDNEFSRNIPFIGYKE